MKHGFFTQNIWKKSKQGVMLAAAFAFVCVHHNLQAQNVSVNPGAGSYATLKDAFDAINAGTHTGAITIDITGNTTETATAVLNASGSGAASYTSVSVSPSGGARSISGNLAAPLVDLNGADNVTINGNGKQLTISNTSTSATAGTSTIRFQADATNNTVTSCIIEGSSTMSTSTNGGTIWFSTGTTTGNDNNTISSCDIAPAGANLPTKAIYFLGSTTTTIFNSGINITGNNIFNYFNAAAASHGMYFNSGNTACTISNNRFYQTATRTQTTGAIHAAVQVASSTGNDGHTFSGNTIGFASAAGTGTYTVVFPVSTSAKFYGIFYSASASTTASSLQGNTITAINVSGGPSGTGTTAAFAGISIASSTAVFNIGDVAGNVVGSLTTAGAISYTTSSTSASDVYGIFFFPSSNVNLSNNSVGGITATGTSSAAALIFYGIRAWTLSSATNIFVSNTVGSTAAPITISSAATGSRVIGIYSLNGVTTATSNQVRNISIDAPNVGTGSSASAIGFWLDASSGANHNIGQNVVQSVSNTNTSAAVWVTGLHYNGSTGGVAQRNAINYISTASSSATATVNGINIQAGTTEFRNNMIALGTDMTANSPQINGINETTAGTDNFYHNSVYIGGSAVAAGTANSFAFNSGITVNTRNYINNIFVNARSNGAATGKHYAIKVGGTTVNPGGLTSNFNDLLASGTGGFVGQFNNIDQLTITDWKLATGQDNSSFSFNPQFLNPTGSATTVDLHISTANPTPIEGAGTNLASVTNDYDGETRAGLTPVDLGADAGNFILLDVVAPSITYTPLPNTCTTGDIALNGVSITDGGGIPVAGALVPRIYYRKNAGAWFSRPGTLASGTATSSTWNFTMVVADLGGLVTGDVVSYYVIAQDNVANISSNPLGAVATDVNTVTTAPAAPNTTTVISPLAGTYAVGPTGVYTTLTAAVNAVVLNGISAPVVLELQPTYTTTAGELFPITLAAVVGCNTPASAVNNITIRPALGATNLSINGTNPSATININGGNWWRIDGRPGGVGNAKELSITNNSLTGQALQFINEASNNIVNYTKLQGVNNTATSAVVVFGTTTGANGNDNNLIDNCDISDGATTPVNGILALGTTTTVATYNDNNSITNCNIFNFFSSTLNSTGIKTDAGNSAWTISNNSLYQTALTPRTITTAAVVHRGLWITPNTGNLTPQASGFVISGNFIGGMAPNAGSTPYNVTSTTTAVFLGMDLSVGNGVATSVQGNTIQNIAFTTTSTASPMFAGMSAVNGNLNIGTITGNTIGAATGTGAITITNTTSSTGTSWGIRLNGGTSTTLNCRNNTVGGITIAGSATIQTNFIGIGSNGGTTTNVSIVDNTIGSTTTANSINLSTVGTGTGSVTGIAVTSGPTIVNVSGNTVANLNNNSTATTTAQARGIVVSVGVPTITNNTIRNLSNSSSNTSGAPLNAVIGLVMNSSSAGVTVTGNIIHSLFLNSAVTTGAIQAEGIFYSGATTGTNSVSKNFIHSFDAAAVNPAILFTGIDISAGTAAFFNNMIRLGVKPDGTDLTTALTVRGISSNSGNTLGFYFNSIYIGGSGVGTNANNTFAFTRTTSAGTYDVRNNILVNNRSNATTGGIHYAVRLTTASTGFTSNYNDYQYTGTGGIFANNGVADVPVYTSGWLASDVNSIVGNPQFIAPTGTASTVDLHIHPTNPTVIESAGIPITGITDDYDSQLRASFTPTDIGADAGNFVVNDISAPVISYTLLTAGCGTGDIALNGVSIVDGTGVPTAGALRPRIYYRKGAGSWFSQPGTLASGTGTNGTWNFTMLAADMGGLAAADVVQYYVIAQDLVATPNIASSPSGAVATDVNTVTTAPTTPNSVTVLNTLSGTFTVGAAGTYPTLTAAVNAYNNSCLAGPVTFNLIDAAYTTAETFPITINAVSGSSATNTLTIKATLPGTVITGSSASGLIVLNGADFVTIDGSTGNTVNTICPPVTASRDLTITNTNTGTSSAVIWLQTVAPSNGATNNVIRNCNLVGNSNTTTLFGVGMGSSTIGTSSLGVGNNNNAIVNNNISKAQFGIYSQGASAINKNSGNIINQNVMATVVADNVARGGILVGFENGISISGNRIENLTTSLDIFGISVGMGTDFVTTTTVTNEVTNATVNSNNLSNIVSTSTTGFSAIGIAIGAHPAGSTVTVSNNTISQLSSLATPSDYISGIMLGGGAGMTQVYHNTVSLSGLKSSGTTGGSSPSYALSVSATTAPVLDIKNNILINTQTSGNATPGKSFAIGLGYTSTLGNYANLISNNNNLFTGGAQGVLGKVGSLTQGSGTELATLANWSTETGRDLNSQSTNPVFASASDLHLVAANPANASLICGGTPLAAVPVDIDCAPRGSVTTTIGADELSNNLAVTLAVVENSGTANDAIICNGSSVDINSTVVNGVSPTYLWSNNAVTANLTGLTPNASTSYTVTVTAAGCQATASASVTVNASPTAGIVVTETSGIANNDGIICAGAAAQLAASGGGTYLWSAAGNPTAATIAVLPPGTTTYTLTVTGANGCTSTASTTITVNPLPTASITSSGTALCVNATRTLTGNPAGGTFSVTSGPGTIAAGVLTATGAGTINLSYTFTDGNGCSATATQAITVNPLPTATITGNASACIGSNVTLTANGGTSYVWGTLETTQSVTLVMPGAPSVIDVTVTDANGCSAVAIQGLTPLFLPEIVGTAIAEPTTCVSNDGAISFILFTANNPTYNWATPNGSGLVQGQANQAALGVGTYNVTITSSNGCSTTSSITLVGPGNCAVCPTVGALSASPSPVCAGSSTTLSVNNLTDMGITYGISFVRFDLGTTNPYSGGTPVASVANAALGSGGTTASASSAALPAGTHFIYAILSPAPTDPTCRPYATTTLTVNPLPVVSITSSNAALCVNGTRALAGSPANGTFSVVSGPGTIAAGVLTATGAGTINIAYSFTDAAGLDKEEVRRGLALMDAHEGEIWAKLDAGTEAYYRLVNRTTIRFDRILKNLLLTARARPIIIQSLFLRVHGAPPPAAEVEAYAERLLDLLRQGAQIKEVHAYTVARPTPETFATRLEPELLEGVADVIRARTGLTVLVFP